MNSLMSLYVNLYLFKIMNSYIQIFKTDLVKRTYNIDTKLTKAFKMKKKRGGGAFVYFLGTNLFATRDRSIQRLINANLQCRNHAKFYKKIS